MKNKKYMITIIVIFACVFMGFVDAVLKPSYAIKSAIKIVLFLLLPFLYEKISRTNTLSKLLAYNKKSIKTPLLLGISIYAIILVAYFLLKNIFDFSSVTKALGENIGVNKANFVWVALYISFVNSLLEEFFFRGFAFFSLKRVSSRKFAYILSSLAFSLYHIEMMIGWFGLEVVALAIFGLFIGGFIFNYINEKSENIYTSWLIHMFANFAINTIGFILFGII